MSPLLRSMYAAGGCAGGLTYFAVDGNAITAGVFAAAFVLWTLSAIGLLLERTRA